MEMEFVETMRGWLHFLEHGEHPVSFEVHACGEGGRFQLRGLISAPPLSREAVATGSLTIAPLLRSIAYHLEFEGPAGERFVLEAEKHPTPASPIRSMTEMEAVVRDAAGRAVAQGTMVFDLRDLPAFAASWIPFRRRAQRMLDTRRRALERRLLTEG